MMNVFYVDSDPCKAAEMLCDKHVVKMILESAQMLSAAHRILDGDDVADSKNLYKLVHKNHPSTLWARANSSNFQWLWEHMSALMTEYNDRYGKVHATERLEHSLWEFPRNITHDVFNPPPQCMPDQYKCNPNSASKADCVSAYRQYYLGEKMHFAEWKFKEAPSWAIV
jgi:hypothetical protein